MQVWTKHLKKMRLSLVMNVNNKNKIAFVQIAGLPRRIVNDAQEGNKLVTGQILR